MNRRRCQKFLRMCKQWKNVDHILVLYDKAV